MRAENQAGRVIIAQVNGPLVSNEIWIDKATQYYLNDCNQVTYIGRKGDFESVFSNKLVWMSFRLDNEETTRRKTTHNDWLLKSD